MKTVKYNVFLEHRKWMLEHRSADRLMMDRAGNIAQAVYISPLEKWKDHAIAPDGTVEVPDMDYYNSLTTPNAIEAAIDDLQDAGFLPPSPPSLQDR